MSFSRRRLCAIWVTAIELALLTPCAAFELVQTLRSHQLPIDVLAISSDGRYVASGAAHADRPGEIVIWNLQTGKQHSVLRGHTEGISGLAFSPERRHLASAGRDNKVIIWDVDTGKQLATLSTTALPLNLFFTPNGMKLVLQISTIPELQWWDVREVAQPRLVSYSLSDIPQGGFFRFSSNHESMVIARNFIDDNRLARRRSLSIYTLKTGKETQRFLLPVNTWIEMMSLSGDGSLLAVATSEKSIRIWNTKDQSRLTVLTAAEDIVAMTFSRCSRYLIGGSHNGHITIWDISNGKIVTTLRKHTDSVRDLVITPDGKRLVSCSFDKTVNIWSLSFPP